MVFTLTISLSPIAVLPAEAALGRWFLTAPMKVSRWQLTLTTLQDGKILAVGGSTRDDASGVTATAELYDPATRSWKLTGSMAMGRSSHTATLLNNGQVLIAGGTSTSGWSKTAELYDPTTGTFSLTGAMVHGRAEHTATLLLDGRVLVAGSACEGGGCGTSARAELYDPATGTFSPTGDMNIGRVGHVAVRLASGKVLAAGGSGFTPSELFDPMTGGWSLTGDLTPARSSFAGVLLPSGKVFVAGGTNQTAGSTDYPALSSAKFYDPATGTWTDAPDMPNRRAHFDMAVQTNGYVVVTGGTTNGSDSLAAYDLFHGADGGVPDVGNATWGSGTMQSRRTHHRVIPYQHTAMAAGGFDYDTGAPTRSAETLGLEPGVLLVTNTNDGGPGSLRAALEAANSDGVPNRVIFNIPTTDSRWDPAGFAPIRLLSPLPPITDDGTTIDGTTQTAFTGDTNPSGPEVSVERDIHAAGSFDPPGPAFEIRSDSNTIAGLALLHFPCEAILIQDWPNRPSGNAIWGNYIGLGPRGKLTEPFNGSGCGGERRAGIKVVGGVDTVIGGSSSGDRNVISGNAGDGIHLAGGTTGTVIEGNYIGIGVSGSGMVPNGGRGVWIRNGSNNAIRGNVVSGNGAEGVALEGGSDSVVQGNLVGTDARGTAALPNGHSVSSNADGVRVNALRATIGGTTPAARNVISGNSRFGLFIGKGGHQNVVQGNFIGTDITGTVALPNGTGAGDGAGIYFKVSCPDVDCFPADNVIGGTAAGARNLISGNGGPGLFLPGARNRVEGNLIGTDITGTSAVPNLGDGISLGGVDGVVAMNVISGNRANGLSVRGLRHLFEGNFIGTNAAGTAVLPNRGTGISLEPGAMDATVGGTSASARNVISGNSGGIALRPGSARARIQGNYIGTDVTGSFALPNAGGGIGGKVTGDCPDFCPMDHAIGGSAPGAGNLISGNGGSGIHLQGERYVVEGNRIGTDAAGSAAIPNGADGIVVGPHGGVRSSLILRNTVAHNAGAGVNFPTCCPTQYSGPLTIRENAIFGNSGLGIDLGIGGDGVTPNDPGDSDTGPNGLQNFPMLYMAMPAGQNVLVRGFVDSPNPSTITVELFGNDEADPSGHGEGERFVGTVTPNANGCFTILIDAAGAGRYVTATATDAAGNTSEFSAATAVRSGRPSAPPRCGGGN